MNIVAPPVRIVNAIAFTFGAEDALSGELCLPEICFTRHAEMRDYCQGFESVAGPTLLSRQILDEQCAPDGELQRIIDYGAELEEYRDWIADQEYHRSGNW